MITKLYNDLLEVEADTSGAELVSIKGKKDNTEYLWSADSKYWSRHAPILFPIVGKVRNNLYRIGDKEYSLGQHGFARDNEFQIVEVSDNKVIYRLTSSKDTLKIYPYDFQLDVEYILKENSLKIIYKVRNTDSETIFFSIGAHPGFNCPLSASESVKDYFFDFSEKETAERLIFDGKTGLLTNTKKIFLQDENTIKLSETLFKEDAIIFKNLKSKTISLRNNLNNKKITMEFGDFPYIGLWSKPEGAPFICIEPWFGHADYEDFTGDFSEKSGIISLEKDQEFNCAYTISIEQ